MNLRSVTILTMSLATMSAAAAWQLSSKTESADNVLNILKPGPVRYWKGNLHTHSLWSDGDDFPEMIADWYKRHGYNFLALSDHNVLSEGQRWIPEDKAKLALKKYLTRFGPTWVEQRDMKGKKEVRLKPLGEFRSMLDEAGSFIMVQGEEITHRFAKAPVHINAFNLRDKITPVDGNSVAETIRANHRLVSEQRQKTTQRMIASLNHPNWHWGVRAEDMLLADELRFFEVFNGHPGVANQGDKTHASTERMWDIVLALRLGKHKLPVVYGLATDDAHSYHKIDATKSNPGRGWLMVRAPYLSPEALVDALDAGNFYSSSGVTLKHIERKGEVLSIAIQPEPGIKYHTQFIATMKDVPFTSEPVVDDKGKTLDVTRLYSADIGKVVQETDSLEPSYRFTGQELYVRAKITSTKPHPNPYKKGDTETAWVQPQVP